MIFKYPVLKGAVFLLFKKYRIFLQKSVFFMQKMYYNIFCIICAIMRCFLMILYNILHGNATEIINKLIYFPQHEYNMPDL